VQYLELLQQFGSPIAASALNESVSKRPSVQVSDDPKIILLGKAKVVKPKLKEWLWKTMFRTAYVGSLLSYHFRCKFPNSHAVDRTPMDRNTFICNEYTRVSIRGEVFHTKHYRKVTNSYVSHFLSAWLSIGFSHSG
jgi:hypothetical protein